MNDRFKFRVWCENNKEWETDEICISNKDCYIINQKLFTEEEPKHHIIVFCTGLKDKNGKLIYKGDILKIKEVNIPVEVKYRAIGFYLYAEPTNTPGYHNDKYIPEDCEVIGNIYENKELLEC